MYTEYGIITAMPPFDWSKTLAMVDGFTALQSDQRIEGRALWKALFCEGQGIVVRLCAEGSPETPQVAYTLWATQPAGPALRYVVEDRLSFWLSLMDDLHPFYALAQVDADFAPLVERLAGYHQVKFTTPFECACWAVLAQRNRFAAARKQKRALAERLSDPLTVEGATYYPFPEPAQVLRADPATVLEAVRNGQKAEFLGAVAWAFAQADESWLRRAPYDEVAAWLRRIKGIGAWSAPFILLRGLGHTERVPLTDPKVLRAASEVYTLGQLLDAEAVARLAAPYGPWQGYWAHYLRVAS